MSSQFGLFPEPTEECYDGGNAREYGNTKYGIIY